MTKLELELAHQLLDAAQKAGADAADALVVQGASLSVEVHSGAVEHAERAEGIDLGLRVFVGQRSATASVSDASEATISELAARAVVMAKAAPEDTHAGLADADQLAQDRDMSQLELAEAGSDPQPELLSEQALIAEAAALAVDGVTQVQSAAGYYSESRVAMVASNGFEGSYARTSHGVYCTAIAGTGTAMERDGDGDARVYRADLRDAGEIGTIAGQRAAERFGAVKPPTGSYPVLFDERISSSLIGHLLAAANGASIARGSSWLLDKLDQLVLPDGLSLQEDPHRKRMSSSRLYDGEGLPTAKRNVVQDGVLTGWALDLANARKLVLAPTGNAKRSMGGNPGPGFWNVALTQGDQSRADLIRDMGEGLLVTGLIGSTINPNTGDYSRGASGFWVKDGQISHPVNECTIAGSLPDMLRRIIPANDARTYLSTVVPSLLVEGLTVAGT